MDFGHCYFFFFRRNNVHSFNLHMSERILEEQQQIKRDFHSNERRRKEKKITTILKNILFYGNHFTFNDAFKANHLDWHRQSYP